MYVKYGSFEFEGHEAGLEVKMVPNRTPRGFRKTMDIRFDIQGELCIDGQNDIDTRMRAIYEAFRGDYQDIGLYFDNDTPTIHYLQSAHQYNLTGNQVLYTQFPQTIDGEFITGRKFSIGVGATIVDLDVNLLEYRDTIKLIGNAGPDFDLRWNDFWGYYFERQAPFSMQTIIHQGYAVGMVNYITPPPPFYPIPFEQNKQRMVDWIGPDRYPQGVSDYTTRWRYIYLVPIANDLLRPTRR